MEGTADRDPVEFSKHKEAIDSFKAEWIYKAINEDEEKAAHFASWLRLIDFTSEEIEWYLRPDGKLCLQDKPESLFKAQTRVDE